MNAAGHLGELELRRHRAGDDSARLPLLRSIAGIAAALRNTG